jgi:uncharacterized membrane protein
VLRDALAVASATAADRVIFDSGGWSLLMNFGVGLLVICLLLFSWTLRPVCHAN